MNKIISLFLFLMLLVLSFSVKTQAADTSNSALVSQLKTACYDQYLINYLDKKTHTSVTAFSITEATEDEISSVREQYRAWAQLNIELAACYEKELSNYPEYSQKVADLKNSANEQLQKVASFDFGFLLAEKQTISSTIKIAAKETRVFRLRTFCLDGGRSIPDTGEDFYLAGSTSEIRSDDLCTILKEAQNATDIEEVQGAVWDTQKFPSKEAVNKVPAAAPTIPWTTKALAWGMSVGGVVIFLLILILGLIRWPRAKILKIFWLIGLLVFLGVASYGVVKLNNLGYFSKESKSEKSGKEKPKIKTLSGKTSLMDAVREGKAKVSAFGISQIVEIDIMVTNNTSENLELDTVCLYFLPTNTTAFSETSLLPFWHSIITPAQANPGMGAQRVGSSGTTGDGPPIPGRMPKPESLLTTAMKQLASKNLKEALEKFKQDPNEETLKETLEELGNCQAVGCDAEEGAMNQLRDGWQGVMDEKLEAYKNDPSTENQEALLRATETGQYLGCNDSAALAALGLSE